MHHDIDLILPEWLDACRIADSLVEAAYEDLAPPDKGILKKTIASLHSFYGEIAPWHQCSRQVQQGFLATATNASAPYVLLFCEPGYCYPQSYLAALMPAVFSAVPHILPCFILSSEEPGNKLSSQKTCHSDLLCPPSVNGVATAGEVRNPDPFLPGPSGFSGAMLTALDLAGVEQLFQLEPEQAHELLANLVQDNGIGRVIILGGKGWSDPLLLKAVQLSVPCLHLPALPAYTACEVSSAQACQAITTSALHLDSCNSDIWIWPSLSLDWFQNTILRISGK